MAAQGSRTLKLSLLADVAEFSKNIKGASKDTETIGDQFTAFGKKAAVAFAAAGAAIGAFAIASVKAAAEDETGQRKLEETIRNTTSATADQIAGIDKYVTAQSIATATTDDIIRPALSRLLRATGDLNKSQELLTLSQEIAAATGKPLEAVTNAVAKSFEGSNTALGKLGVGISAATLKTLTFDETQQLLNKTFDGFIENQAETAAFKFQQISIAVNESKEAIGAALLPVVKQLADFLIVTVVPAIESFVAGLTGKDSLAEGLSESQTKAVEWGKKVRGIIDTVIDLKDQLVIVGGIIATIFVTSKIAAAVQGTIVLITSLIKAYNLLKASALVAGIASAFALNPLLGVGAVALAAAVLAAANALVGSDEKLPQFAVGGAPGAIKGGIGAGGSAGGAGGGGGGGGGGVVPKITIPNIPEIKGDAGGTEGVAGAGTTDSQNTARLIAAAAAASASMSDINARTMAIRARERGDVPATVVINVNAPSVIDEEGFSRATANALNNSTFRGTNGASNLVYL
jgi:hypothetical protein